MKKSKKSGDYIKYVYKISQREQVSENGYKRYIKKVEEAPRKKIKERQYTSISIGEPIEEIKLRKIKTSFKRSEKTKYAQIIDNEIPLKDNKVKLRKYKDYQLHIPKRIIFTATRPARLINLLEIIKGENISSPQDAVLEILERVVTQEIKLLNAWDMHKNDIVIAKYDMIVSQYDISNKKDINYVRIISGKNYYFRGITGNNNIELMTYNGVMIYITKEQFEYGFNQK